MEIGGTDLIIKTNLSEYHAATIVLNMITGHWPDVVYELVDSEKSDMFIYENNTSKEIWDKGKDVPSSRANMIYALFDNGQITLAYDRGFGSEVVCLRVQQSFEKEQENGIDQETVE